MIVKVNPVPVLSGGPPSVRIPLSRGHFFLIDLSCHDSVTRWKWHLRKSGHNWYVCRKKCKFGITRIIYLHRWLMFCPDNMVVHHINSNTLDNRKANLEIITPSENSQYRTMTKVPLMKQ